ncbi:MAG: response regulator [Deltaproteobacteria bacterium]|nr:response regulator [Deltaproteobacteria bacterium]MBM4324324.1 response regulator [Deltaproteobacteria bacterium]
MKGRICIVDHDLASRGYLRECLEREGHEVIIVDSGFQVKPLLNGEGFNVFILNINSPGVRDKNLLIELKKTKPLRILLIVSERGDSFLKEAIDLGVYGFIYRPFNSVEICTMVSHLIR